MPHGAEQPCCPTNQCYSAHDKYLIQGESSGPHCCYRYQAATRLAIIPTSNGQKAQINNEPNPKMFAVSPQGERKQPRLDMAAPLSQKDLDSCFLSFYFPHPNPLWMLERQPLYLHSRQQEERMDRKVVSLSVQSISQGVQSPVLCLSSVQVGQLLLRLLSLFAYLFHQLLCVSTHSSVSSFNQL